jgi:peptide-methionine (S)-S-oxide reductase
MALFGRDKSQMIAADQALPGRSTPLPRVPETHYVNGHRIQPPFPEGLQTAVFGMGCFWGAERIFWQTPGVYSTAVGYAGGFTPNPPTRRRARASPGTPRSCSSCSTRSR